MLCPHRKSVGLGLRPKLLGRLNEHHICNQLVNVAAHVRQRVTPECNRTNGKHVVSEHCYTPSVTQAAPRYC